MTNWFKTLFTPVQTPAPGDPFAHSDIAAMSHRDLADLPLTPPPAPSARMRSQAAGTTHRSCPAA